MDRTTGTLAKGVVSFLLGYAVGSLLRGRKTGRRVGLAVGVAVALADWLGRERPDALDDVSDGDADPVEIEI